MRTSFLQNDRIFLRAVEPEDLDLLYTMENDPKWWDISNFCVPYSKYVLRQYIENSQCDVFADKQLRLIIVEKENLQTVGSVDLTDFVPRHSRAEVGIALRTEYQKKGYATDALKLLCQYVFEFLGLTQLCAHIAVDNNASLQLFEGCGFVQCGYLKKWLVRGEIYIDAILLQYLNPHKHF